MEGVWGSQFWKLRKSRFCFFGFTQTFFSNHFFFEVELLDETEFWFQTSSFSQIAGLQCNLFHVTGLKLLFGEYEFFFLNGGLKTRYFHLSQAISSLILSLNHFFLKVMSKSWLFTLFTSFCISFSFSKGNLSLFIRFKNLWEFSSFESIFRFKIQSLSILTEFHQKLSFFIRFQ